MDPSSAPSSVPVDDMTSDWFLEIYKNRTEARTNMQTMREDIVNNKHSVMYYTMILMAIRDAIHKAPLFHAGYTVKIHNSTGIDNATWIKYVTDHIIPKLTASKLYSIQCEIPPGGESGMYTHMSNGLVASLVIRITESSVSV